MVNFDLKRHYIVTPDDPKVDGRGMPSLGNQIMDSQLYYLFETEWLSPTLLKTTTGVAGTRPADIVETRVHDSRTDFVFDRTSHLLVQMRTYHSRGGKEISDNVIDLSDYIEVEGLQVPTKVMYEGGVEYLLTFQFNVDYDENIFLTPPPIEAGSKAWRLKKANFKHPSVG